MAISDMLNRRVRARPEEDDVDSEASDSRDHLSQDEDDSESEDEMQLPDDADNSEDMGEEEEDDQDVDEEDLSDEDNGDDDIQASLSNISFGALAKAQSSVGPKKRKEKHSSKQPENSTSTASPLDDIRARIREAREQKREAAQKDTKDPQTKKTSRASKHAPMVQSSKHPVTRKRTVVEPPAAPKARDPRFDAAIMGYTGAGKHHSESTSKAYAFLDEYRASELKELKEQLGKTKNAEQKEALKRQIRSASDRMRAMENQKRERKVMADHKKQEKELLREGKKSTPYYLKKSDLKKQVMQKKYEEMGSRDRAKALERRRKKIASKERKDMPMERRGMEGGGGAENGGKRRRLA
ncbi:hypothetical protein NUU61_007204 [Penicillium alfredii]|uniref:rRNA biogenesis protein RRP36 n=1 Tax=Penicillium alfredii TaxID=1506179 RepID=A0A9W9F2E7_9EURO|nr:uncharacterized protein NUU61_007204 [Penicillium alfredii]KAJ5092334.1 hypothetical protein NUU61_007204 [Penicillium alfredii]